MTKREDNLPNSKGWRRLSYTCRCGWVDWGHASAGAAAELREKLKYEKSFLDFPMWHNLKLNFNNGHETVPAFALSFKESMGKFGVNASHGNVWIVKKGLTAQQKERVAFSIFVATSMGFEKMQSSFPFSLFSDSGFSGEDLVSNLVGFYRAFRKNHNQDSDSSEIRRWCGEVSVEESLRIWDKFLSTGGLGAAKNRSFDPLRFQTDACKGKDCSFPSELKSFQGAPYGQWFVRLANPAMSHQMKLSALNTVDRNGIVRLSYLAPEQLPRW